MTLRNLSVEAASVVIFGASGDLTRRKLIPALHTLGCEGFLPAATQVLGVARTPYTDKAFCDELFGGVQDYARLKPGVCTLWFTFEDRVSYLSGDYEDPETYRRLAERLGQLEAQAGSAGNRLFYLATPPNLYPEIVEHLGQAGLNHDATGWTRIIIEKPFGTDLESARRLNEQVHAVFTEGQVYRIDHYDCHPVQVRAPPDVPDANRHADDAEHPDPVPTARRRHPPAL